MNLVTKAISLGRIHPGAADETFAVSPNSNRVAYWVLRGATQEVLATLRWGKAPGMVGLRTPMKMSQVFGEWGLVVDGVEAAEEARILGSPPIFSPDSNRVAYVAVRGEKMRVVVDGREGGEYDAISTPTFSPDSNRVAYAAVRAGKGLIVVDGEEGMEYEGIMKGTPLFSPDSKRVAYAALLERGGEWVAVVDGQQGKRYDLILNHNLLFSPDSQRVAYMAARAPAQWTVVLDGQEGKEYEDVLPGTIAFSPDSNRLAFAAGRVHKQFVVLKRWTFFVVLDGDEGKEHQGTIAGASLIFSHDSRRLAYMVGRRHKVSVVVDGDERNPHECLGTLLFSPDSKRVAYVAVRGARLARPIGGGLEVSEGGKYSLVVDQVTGKEYDFIRNVVFTPDSKYVLFAATRAHRTFVVLNGVEGNHYDDFARGSSFGFDGPRTCHTLAISGEEIFRVEFQIVDD